MDIEILNYTEALKAKDLSGIESFLVFCDNLDFSLTDIVERALEHATRFSEPHKEIIRAAACLAAEKNDNPFHNNHHFLEVFSFAYVNGLDALQHDEINEEDFMRLLSAALIHDYKHDGKTNGNVQFRLEQQSFDAARDFLESAGASERDLSVIELMLLATDTGVAQPEITKTSPASSLKHYLKSGNIHDIHPGLLKKFPEFVTPSHANLVMMLHDADLAPSACFSADYAKNKNEKFRKENDFPADETSVRKSYLFFLEHILQKQAFSTSGQRVLQNAINNTLQEYGIEPVAIAPSAPSLLP